LRFDVSSERIFFIQELVLYLSKIKKKESMQTATASPEIKPDFGTFENQNIPKELIYEILDGKPIYFKGYKEYLKNEKTLDDIMATGRLQTRIINAVQKHLIQNYDSKGFEFLSNEVGIHVSLSVNFSCDLVAFDKTVLAASEDDNHYYNFPPKFVIEVDTNADIQDANFMEYFFAKSKKLIEFGVEKMIWILTASQTVTVMTSAEEKWITQNWNKPIEIFDGDSIILEELFKESGIKI
jgi:Putative restriction endonuclease